MRSAIYEWLAYFGVAFLCVTLGGMIQKRSDAIAAERGTQEWRYVLEVVWEDESGNENTATVPDWTLAFTNAPKIIAKRLELVRFSQAWANGAGIPVDPGASSPMDSYNHCYPGIRGDYEHDTENGVTYIRAALASDTASRREE